MTMRTTQLGANKALVRKAVGYNHGSSDSADEIFAPDFVAYMPSQPPMDRAGMERFIGDFADAFPGYTYEIHEQVAHGDMVFNHTTWRGVHSGTFAGVTATGRSIELGGINVFKVRDGSVVERANWTFSACCSRSAPFRSHSGRDCCAHSNVVHGKSILPRQVPKGTLW